jgi:hypothetical protein
MTEAELEAKRQALIESGEKINLKETILFLQQFERKQIGIIKSKFPTINGLKIEISKKSYRSVNFLTPWINNVKSPINFQHIGYGFQRPFSICLNNIEYVVRDSVGSYSMKLGKEFKGDLWTLETISFKLGDGFFRALIPLDKLSRPPIDYLSTKHFSVGDTLSMAGYAEIDVDSSKIGFFNYTINSQSFLVIESKSKICYSCFKNALEVIIYALGFLSGSLIRGEVTVLKFEDGNFTNLIGSKFKRLKKSINSSVELISPRKYSSFKKLDRTAFFPLETFSTLCNLCSKSKPLLRAVRIITESKELPVEIQAASLFVALETIKQVIIDENIDALSPIKREFETEVKDSLKNKIVEIDDSKFNNKSIILKKIENLNKVANNDGFNQAFAISKFELSKEDKRCIKMRNEFLHGRIPFEDEDDQKREKKLLGTTLDISLLTSALILKHSKYSGPILDYLKYWDQVNDIPNDRPLFREI